MVGLRNVPLYLMIKMIPGKFLGEDYYLAEIDCCPTLGNLVKTSPIRHVSDMKSGDVNVEGTFC